MSLAGKTVLVTGSNRGIGKALAAEALARGAARVYCGTRQPLNHSDERIVPLTLDITDPDQIEAAAGQVESLDILINNAGIMIPDVPFDPAILDRHMAVNVHGSNAVTQAFLPALIQSKDALAISTDLGDRHSAAGTYHHLGLVAQEQQKLEQAERYYRQAADTYREFKDWESAAFIYHQLSLIAKEQTEFQRVEQYYQEALLIAQRFSD